MKLTTLLTLAAQACLTIAATPAEWRSRSIYFIMTDRFARTDGSTTAPCNVADGQYCGGTWRGLINKLDYIQGMGFTAIWITPVTHNIETKEGTKAYHGYWQDDLYTLNGHYGSPSDLLALSRALKARGMYLMIDVVANHFGAEAPPDAVDYSKLRPFNDKKYFHPPCDPNYDDQTSTEQCWLAYGQHVNLPDLNTTRNDVRALYYTWIAGLTRAYQIDGLRVDTVKHVEKPFWPGFNRASGVYNIGEVFNGDRNYLCDYQNYMDGLLNYPLYYPLMRAFQSSSGSMTDLANEVNGLKTTCKDTTLLGNFLENHDNPRYPSQNADQTLVKNAIAFTMNADGIPVIYYGQEQFYNGANDPYDREALWLSKYNTQAPLYKAIATMNKLRNNAIAKDRGYTTYKANVVYTDANTIALRKGSDNSAILSVYSNKGTGAAPYTVTVPNTGYSAGTQLIEALSCAKTTAGTNGAITSTVTGGQPNLYYSAAKLKGTGICGQ